MPKYSVDYRIVLIIKYSMGNIFSLSTVRKVIKDRDNKFLVILMDCICALAMYSLKHDQSV